MGESIFKKVLSLILAALLIMPQTYAAAAENRSREVDFICLIGLMVGDDNGDFRENDYVTRAEAARVLYELADDAVISGTLPSDTQDGAWYKPYVDKVVGTGIMKNISGSMFMPLQNAAADDMIQAMLHILGYNDEISASAKAELLRGIGLGTAQDISRGQFAKLIYNALYMDTVSVSYDGTEYAKSDVSLLEKYLYRTDRAIYRGVVQSTDRGSIVGTEADDEGYATVSGVRYDSTYVPNITELLGKSVEFIAQFSDTMSTPMLLGVTEYKNDCAELYADDIESISAEKITYLDDNDRPKTMRLDSRVKFVYNNFLVENVSVYDMQISNGSYVLLDNDNDGRYDIIFAKEYRSFVVKEVSEFLSTIYFESGSWNGRKSISAQSLSGKDYDCRITDTDGNDI